MLSADRPGHAEKFAELAAEDAGAQLGVVAHHLRDDGGLGGGLGPLVAGHAGSLAHAEVRHGDELLGDRAGRLHLHGDVLRGRREVHGLDLVGQDLAGAEGDRGVVLEAAGGRVEERLAGERQPIHLGVPELVQGGLERGDTLGDAARGVPAVLLKLIGERTEGTCALGKGAVVIGADKVRAERLVGGERACSRNDPAPFPVAVPDLPDDDHLLVRMRDALAETAVGFGDDAGLAAAAGDGADQVRVLVVEAGAGVLVGRDRVNLADPVGLGQVAGPGRDDEPQRRDDRELEALAGGVPADLHGGATRDEHRVDGAHDELLEIAALLEDVVEPLAGGDLPAHGVGVQSGEGGDGIGREHLLDVGRLHLLDEHVGQGEVHVGRALPGTHLPALPVVTHLLPARLTHLPLGACGQGGPDLVMQLVAHRF